MTCTKKADSVPSRMARLQNRLIDYQELVQEINPPDIKALQQTSRKLEDENGELRRRVRDIERRKVEEAEELKEENRELEEEIKS
ncbi:hypothetical protein C2G38_2232452 [Gigaspora rosea]|uniref:Uncharacterized protein n=1 Tax=Gigaspora rosea TaxID=44941 RepID=A0A397U1G8_9GLOM|nr:hypothetical protein C2G38_2232452 [Gigaspora rosea]